MSIITPSKCDAFVSIFTIPLLEVAMQNNGHQLHSSVEVLAWQCPDVVSTRE